MQYLLRSTLVFHSEHSLCVNQRDSWSVSVCVCVSDLLSRLCRLMEIFRCVSSLISAFLFMLINIMTLCDQQKTDWNILLQYSRYENTVIIFHGFQSLMSFNNAAVLSETIKRDKLFFFFFMFGHYIKLHQCFCVKIKGWKDYHEAENLPWYKKFLPKCNSFHCIEINIIYDCSIFAENVVTMAVFHKGELYYQTLRFSWISSDILFIDWFLQQFDRSLGCKNTDEP